MARKKIKDREFIPRKKKKKKIIKWTPNVGDVVYCKMPNVNLGLVVGDKYGEIIKIDENKNIHIKRNDGSLVVFKKDFKDTVFFKNLCNDKQKEQLENE